jgi:hypothetical protein
MRNRPDYVDHDRQFTASHTAEWLTAAQPGTPMHAWTASWRQTCIECAALAAAGDFADSDVHMEQFLAVSPPPKGAVEELSLDVWGQPDW